MLLPQQKKSCQTKKALTALKAGHQILPAGNRTWDIGRGSAICCRCAKSADKPYRACSWGAPALPSVQLSQYKQNIMHFPQPTLFSATQPSNSRRRPFLFSCLWLENATPSAFWSSIFTLWWAPNIGSVNVYAFVSLQPTIQWKVWCCATSFRWYLLFGTVGDDHSSCSC